MVFGLKTYGFQKKNHWFSNCKTYGLHSRKRWFCTMATARKTKSGKWRCQVLDRVEMVDGKKKYIHRSFTARTKYEAERMAAEFKEQKNRPSCDLKFGEAIDKYLSIKENVLSPSTYRRYKSMRDNCYGSLLQIRIDKIGSEDAQACINDYAVDHSGKSCRNAYGLLTAVLRTFLPGIQIYVKLPQTAVKDYYTPSDDDIKRLMDAITSPDLRRAVLLAAFGTLRRSEICGLMDSDINGDVITIRRAKVEKDGGGYVVKDYPKNDSSNRSVIYPQFVIDEFEGIEGFLIKIQPNSISQEFRAARKRAGLPNFRFHDLRAYSVSIAHAIGIPDVYLMERGGWKTDSTFKKVYRRAISDENREISAKLNAHFEKLHS